MVHIADIDGDGRADWCVLLKPGDISCIRNGGQGDAPTAAYGGFWQGFNAADGGWTTVFPSQKRGNAAGVNLVDINGDFKSDWLFMVSAFIVELNHPNPAHSGNFGDLLCNLAKMRTKLGTFKTGYNRQSRYICQ